LDEPRSPWPGDAGDVLLRALLRLAREREDVRVAMTAVQGWLAQELAAPADGEPEVADSRPTTDPRERMPLRVITPYTEARSAGARSAGARSAGARSVGSRSGRSSDGLDQSGSEPGGSGRPGETTRPVRKVELALVVRRARWKAAACRLALDQGSAQGTGPEREDLRRLEDGLRRRREGLEECPTWMLDPPGDGPCGGSLADAAACFETLALVAEGLVELENAGVLDAAPPSELLYLLAETQSALLAAVHACDQRGDSDQRDLFLWLKDQTTRHRIYVDHHMRLDDPADPARSEERGQRFRELLGRLLSGRNQRQFRSQLLNKIRFHVGKAREAEEAGDHGDHGDHDWEAVGSGAEEWLRLGLSREDGELLALLRPLVEEFGAARALPESLLRLVTGRDGPARTAQNPETVTSTGVAASRPRPAAVEQVA